MSTWAWYYLFVLIVPSCGNVRAAYRRASVSIPWTPVQGGTSVNEYIYSVTAHDYDSYSQPTNMDDRGLLLTRIDELQVVIRSLRSTCCVTSTNAVVAGSLLRTVLVISATSCIVL